MFYMINNLKSQEVKPIAEPWNWDSSSAPWDWTKPEWDSKWLNNASTRHALIKMNEGAMPGIKIGKDNPTCAIHGFIADYDGAIPSDVKEIWEKKAPSAYLPTYAVETKSGKLRLVWEFESPLRVTGDDHAKKFLAYLANQIKSKAWFAGYDAGASENPGQYLCIGKSWTPAFADTRISANVINKWDFEVFRKIVENQKVDDMSGDIPLEDLQAEARARGWESVPERFEEGQHCCRFWDPDSDNPRGCLIVKSGVRVYVPHDKPFMSWADIFGRAFVEKYASEKFSTLASEIWYDSSMQDFWTKDPSTGAYVKTPSASLQRRLKAAGFSSAIPKGETISPMDQVILKIEDTRRVDGVMDYLYFPPGVLKRPDGTMVLNTSKIKVLEPSAPLAASGDWFDPDVAKAFPFIHGFLSHLFRPEIPNVGQSFPPQIIWFLSWLSSFYKSGYYRQPQNGQALFIAGGKGHGKTFLSCHLLPTLMGGVATDVSQHLTGTSRWTSDFAGQPVLNVDDGSGSLNYEMRQRFTNLIKAYVANGAMPWTKKGGAETTVPWFGRIIVTCNTDVDSLSIIPDLGYSNGDKVMVLMAVGENIKRYHNFGEFSYNRECVQRELPIFARYLLDFKIPEEIRDNRFGVVAFHHPTLTNITKASDSIAGLVEALAQVFGPMKTVDANGARRYWEGTALELLTSICTILPSMAYTYRNARALGQELSRMQAKGWDIESIQTNTAVKKWRIAYDVVQRGESEERARGIL